VDDEIRRTVSQLASCSAVLTIELNVQEAADVRVPGVLDRTSAARIAELIVDDLLRLIPQLKQFGVVLPGALYDQTELLRPGFPLLGALEDVFRGTLRDADYQPQLIALGSDDGRAFTIAALNPERGAGAGPLLMLPLLFVGHPQPIAELSTQLENSLLQQGGVSATTRSALEEAFGIRALNASYATVADLCALLKVQLEGAGFDGLWTLLERAFYRPDESCDVKLPSGNRFLLEGGTVYTPFWTFDDFVQVGPGAETAADALVGAYVDWLRQQRQYLMALTAYRMPVHMAIVDGATDCHNTTLRELRAAGALEGDYLVETVVRVENPSAEHKLLITNQFDDDIGTLAYTVAALDADDHLLALEHHYPLTPGGLEAIAARLTERSAHIVRRVLHPGGVIYSAHGRCLDTAVDSELPPATAY